MSDPRFAVIGFPRWPVLRPRLPRFAGGLLCLGAGLGLTVDARLGVSPFDVLHQGIARRTGLTFGTVVVAVGMVILLLWIPLRQPFGVGTVVNTLTVGFLIDGALWLSPPAWRRGGRCWSPAWSSPGSGWVSTLVPASARDRVTGS